MSNTYLAQYYGKSSNYTDIPNHLYKEYNVKKGLRNEDRSEEHTSELQSPA